MSETENGNHYISKEEMHQALVDYRDACRKAQSEGREDPPIPEYIGDCFVKLATRTSYNKKFIGYPFREEMVGDAIENCLSGFRNYNPEEYNNPFGYFSRAVEWTFYRRIAREKKELRKKYNYISEIDIHELVTQEHDNGTFTNQFAEYLKKELDLVDIDQRIVSTKRSTSHNEEQSYPTELVFEDEDESNPSDA